MSNSMPPAGWSKCTPNDSDWLWFTSCGVVDVMREQGAATQIWVKSGCVKRDELPALIDRLKEAAEIAARWDQLPHLTKAQLRAKHDAEEAERQKLAESFVVRLTQAQLDQLVVRACQHQWFDDYRAGKYRHQVFDSTTFKGCAIGCTIHDAVQEGVLPASVSHGDHESLAGATGLHREIWKCLDVLFEWLDHDERVRLTPAFLRTLKPEHDYALAVPSFILQLLTGTKSTQWEGGKDAELINLVVSFCSAWRANGAPPPAELYKEKLMSFCAYTQTHTVFEIAERMFAGHWSSALRRIISKRDISAGTPYRPLNDEGALFVQCMSLSARKRCKSCNAFTAALDGECAACSCF